MDPLTNILVVEDQFVEANHLRIMLKKAGYTICGVARSVEEARKMIADERPGLVLLDIFLSGKETGIDLARYLREEDIPFIYLSASSNEDILHAAKASHPYGFLIKPFREKDLLITLDIARQHMEHGMESGIRKESLFRQQLKELTQQSKDWPQRLLAIVRAMQPLIAFDYLQVHYRTDRHSMYDSQGFLRTGSNEYRSMIAEELPALLQQSPMEQAIQAFTGTAFDRRCEASMPDRVIARQLGMRSSLTIPVPLLISGKGDFLFSLYSRQPHGFTDQHASFCERTQQQLIYALENILARPSQPAVLSTPVAQTGFEGIIGKSPLLLTVFDHITQVASSDTSVLITGESGTGKERIAGSIHRLSPRRNKPLIKISCAALPVNLIESELFGHEKGAFTGAFERRIGKFQQADGGTLFLDEIGELPLEVQAKLLRVLQEREFDRIGGKTPVKVDLRIITATNRNLEKEVAEGRFRLDLYYRLNVFPIHMPSLRQRVEDIPLLVRHFIDHFSRKMGKNISGIAENALSRLQAYHWPGNIRELENIIERSVLLEKGSVIENILLPTAVDAPRAAQQEDSKIRTIQENEKEHILSVLKKCEGRIRGTGGAAEVLGVPPTTLASKMKKLGIRRQFTE